MDGVAKDGVIIAAAIHEHIEQAGVHSGDATLVLPPQNLTAYQKQRVRVASRKIAKRLNITGPLNIQFVAKGTDVMCIECPLRVPVRVGYVRCTYFVNKPLNNDQYHRAHNSHHRTAAGTGVGHAHRHAWQPQALGGSIVCGKRAHRPQPAAAN